jgi:hypothetical protein
MKQHILNHLWKNMLFFFISAAINFGAQTIMKNLPESDTSYTDLKSCKLLS